MSRPKGSAVVDRYEEFARTPHGRLRHDLLFFYYDRFVREHSVERVIDVGGGSGLLVGRLLAAHPRLSAVLVDNDEEMIERAGKRLKEWASRIDLVEGTIESLSSLAKMHNLAIGRNLVSFNHTIEHVSSKSAALNLLADCIAPGSFLGFMHLNNSHEALRRVLFDDAFDALRKQLSGRKVDGGIFGGITTADTREAYGTLATVGLDAVEEYGIHCIADLKDEEFVEKKYDDLLAIETEVGALPDFQGLARYRLAFFSRAPRIYPTQVSS